MRKLLIFILTVGFIICTEMPVVISETYAQENENILPEKFQNEKDAIKHKCKIVTLKDAKQKSCVIQELEMQTLKLTIYDADSKGEFIKSQQICIPSWYGKAKVNYQNLLDDVKQFIFVEFEGNRGTGTLQMILMIIGWHNDKFVPVLAETIDYYIAERADVASLKMDYVIKNLKTPKVSLRLNHKFLAKDENEFPFKFNATWTEILTWNEKNYSFYDEQSELKKFWNVPCFIQKNIANVRLATRNLDVTRLCDDFFEKTKIMSILDAEEYSSKNK